MDGIEGKGWGMGNSAELNFQVGLGQNRQGKSIYTWAKRAKFNCPDYKLKAARGLIDGINCEGDQGNGEGS